MYISKGIRSRHYVVLLYIDSHFVSKCSISAGLVLLRLLVLRQVVLLKQGRNFFRVPQLVVNLAVLCLPYRSKLDYNTHC